MAVGSGMVDQFMAALEHPLKAEIERLRAIIIGANAGISEQIKWKAPSFCYRGDDRVTMKLHPVSQVQLIFHRGSKPKDTANFAFEDNSGLLKWAAKDRGVATFRNMAEIEQHKVALRDLLNRWMIATSE
ncbi:MAG TPA: DUF1801 domain-containing protein [Thermomicrobiales bacterium]|nr:DUF1801 domain-containing protein [Thermomicrobiales bacterium]